MHVAVEGGLSATNIQQLTADQLALVRPVVISQLPASTLKVTLALDLTFKD
jgi:hypothetical protein